MQKIQWTPEHLGWRVILLRLKDQSFIYPPYPITSKEELQRFCDRHDPIDVYYSQGMFLNPHKNNRPSYQIADTIFLGADICIDLDDVDYSHAKKVLEVMKEYKMIYMLQTSEHSYQLLFRDNEKMKTREAFHRCRKRIIAMLKKHGVKADFVITTDIKRVIRYPLTNHRCGFQTKFLDPHLRGSRQSRKAMKGVAPSITHKGQAGMPVNQPLFLTKAKYMTTQCGKKRVLYLMYNIIKEYEMLYLQKKYHTGSLYAFSLEDGKVGVISTKAMDKRRINKITKASSALNKMSIIKGNIAAIRTSHILTRDGEIHADKPRKMVSLECPSMLGETYSPFHRKFLEHLGFKMEGAMKEPNAYLIQMQRRIQ